MPIGLPASLEVLERHMSREDIGFETISKYLRYDAATGEVFWRMNKGRLAKEGCLAGNASDGRYIQIEVCGHRFYAHRIAWLLHYGVWPTDLIDHINGDKKDNRIENLRDVNKSLNAHNSRSVSRGISGVKGVYFNNRIGRWFSKIRINRESKYLGSFSSAEEAGEAYRTALKDAGRG